MAEIVRSLQHFETMPDGVMFLKERVDVVENGVVITSTWHRTCFTPEDPVDKVPYDQFKLAAIAIRTGEIKKKYSDRMKKEKEDKEIKKDKS